jgi:hypothetical protein
MIMFVCMCVCVCFLTTNNNKVNNMGGVVFPKSAFGHLSLADMNGDYFLRPNRILGMFKFDESSVMATFNIDSADHVRSEISLDMKLESILNNKVRVNKSSIKKRMDNFLREERQAESAMMMSSSSYPSYSRHHHRAANLRVSPLFSSSASDHHHMTSSSSSSSSSSQTLREEDDFKKDDEDDDDDDDYGELYSRDNGSIQSEISALTPSNTPEDVSSVAMPAQHSVDF